MLQGWRWYGPNDPVSLDDIRQAGATDVVTALHQVPIGATCSIEAWIASLEAVASAGIKIICYNFMPVVDWCRTDLEWELPNGARALRFDQDRFAAFELHILKRPAAFQEYSPEQQARAKGLFDKMSPADIDFLIMV